MLPIEPPETLIATEATVVVLATVSFLFTWLPPPMIEAIVQPETVALSAAPVAVAPSARALSFLLEAGDADAHPGQRRMPRVGKAPEEKSGKKPKNLRKNAKIVTSWIAESNANKEVRDDDGSDNGDGGSGVRVVGLVLPEPAVVLSRRTTVPVTNNRNRRLHYGCVGNDPCSGGSRFRSEAAAANRRRHLQHERVTEMRKIRQQTGKLHETTLIIGRTSTEQGDEIMLIPPIPRTPLAILIRIILDL